MKTFAILPLLLFVAFTAAIAQTAGKQPIPRFQRIEVYPSGPAVYTVKETSPFEKSLSDDGSEVYTSEATVGDFNFAVIVVKFVPAMTDATPDDMEMLLESYLEFLQSQFGVTASAGVGKGHTKEGLPAVRGMIDYWQDAEETQYAIKGWVDQSHLAVLMIYGASEYPHFNVQNMFFDGFRFPGEE